MTAVAVPGVEQTHDAAVDLRATRRRRRLGDTQWGDLAYRVYTTAMVSFTILVLLSGWVGDSQVDAAAVRSVQDVGPAWAGLLLAVALLGGVRSGSRGGPLALEGTDVHHLLLAPTNRSLTLRRPTVGVLGYGALTGLVTMGMVGLLMSQRLPGGPTAWMASGAVFGAAMAALALGSALLTSSRVMPRAVPVLTAWVLALWAVADVAGYRPTAPTTYAGRMLFWPLGSDARAAPLLVLAVAAAVIGTLVVGGLSIEAARRRTLLVGQLRFAVTQQDMRSVVLLRRQLAAERPRNRPWFKVPRSFGRRFPVTTRDLQSVAHWPPIRLLRVAVLGAGAGLAVRGIWQGTTPLILVAGLAAFIVGLDATEPLAQDVDHPTLVASLPVAEGVLMLRHLVQPVIVALLAGVVGLVVAWAVDPAPEVLRVGPVIVVTGALGAVASAAVSVLYGSGQDNSAGVLMMPEVAGPRLVIRTAWPPTVAIIGFLPALAAARARSGTDAVGVAVTVGLAVLVLVAMVFTWVRFRADLHRALAESMGGATT